MAVSSRQHLDPPRSPIFDEQTRDLFNSIDTSKNGTFRNVFGERENDPSNAFEAWPNLGFQRLPSRRIGVSVSD